jgi:hypothetical protein
MPNVEYDTELTAFGVAVYPAGIKSCEYRPHGGGRHGKKTCDKTPQLTP